jgi:hypothetical protein
VNNHTHILRLHCPCGQTVAYHVALKGENWEEMLYVSELAERAMMGEYECPCCGMFEVLSNGAIKQAG